MELSKSFLQLSLIIQVETLNDLPAHPLFNKMPSKDSRKNKVYQNFSHS